MNATALKIGGVVVGGLAVAGVTGVCIYKRKKAKKNAVQEPHGKKEIFKGKPKGKPELDMTDKDKTRYANALRDYAEKTESDDIPGTFENELAEHDYPDEGDSDGDEEEDEDEDPEVDYSDLELQIDTSPETNDIPYEISAAMFRDENGYSKIFMTYFTDGVLIDQDGDIVDDQEALVGDLGKIFDTPARRQFVRIRNDRIGEDYEIIRDERSYRKDVLK